MVGWGMAASPRSWGVPVYTEDPPAYDQAVIRRQSLPAIVFILASGGTSLGQIDSAPAAKHWIAGLIALVLVIGVVVASTMSSKRGHRD